jgi:DNA mismatch repair protein MutL
VVKELLENALDAGASRIDVYVANGGRHLIQVTDDGCGMQAEEAVLALQRFTTSKIRHIEDLSTVTTLGFRGEALPSIAVVADIDILSRTAAMPHGALVSSQAGHEPQVRPHGCPLGTRVRVHRLFAHVPVRLRALRSVAREVQDIQELVAHYALAHPHVTFHLQHESRRVLFAPATSDVRQRLAVIFGEEIARDMLVVQWHNVDMAIYGAVSPPSLHRATRQRQYLWVNGRPIRSTLVSAAVERAYGALLLPGRRPVFGLGITVPPQLLDINVHPRKTEIKFLHERVIFVTVQEAVHSVVQQVSAAPFLGEEALPENAAWPEMPTLSVRIHEDPPLYYRSSMLGTDSALRFLGQVANTFLVAASSQGLLLIDQHAAHESLLYEQLSARTAPVCELESPLLLHLTPAQARWLPLLQPALTALGIHAEPFGQHALLIRTVPALLQKLLSAEAFLEVWEEGMQRLNVQSLPEEILTQLAAALACRTAIRAGDPISTEQANEILQAMSQQRLGYTCPHGRPTHVTLTLAELERRFLRLRG